MNGTDKQKASQEWGKPKPGLLNHCPRCKVTNIRWRLRLQSYICNRCGTVFDAAGQIIPENSKK